MTSRFAIITFTDGQGGSIDNTLPGAPAYPSHGLPPGAVTLPVFPFDPTIDNSIPGSGGRPDNTLPPGGTIDNTLPGQPGYGTGQPIVPGKKFIVKYLACTGLILVPDNSLPPTPQPK
jgi:hypothetical protein